MHTHMLIGTTATDLILFANESRKNQCLMCIPNGHDDSQSDEQIRDGTISWWIS